MYVSAKTFKRGEPKGLSKIYYKANGSEVIKNIEVKSVIADKMAMVLGDLVEIVEVINY